MLNEQSDEPAVPVAMLDSYVPVPALMTTLLLFDGRHAPINSKLVKRQNEVAIYYIR